MVCRSDIPSTGDSRILFSLWQLPVGERVEKALLPRATDFPNLGCAMSEVGEQLRRSRQAQGMSLAQVADHTKLRADHLEALERGDFSVFPAPVYVRGTVRTYAQMLHLDLAPLLARLDEELARSPEHANAVGLAGRRRTPLDALTYQLSKIDWRLAAWLGGGALVLLLGVAGVRWWQGRAMEDPLRRLGPGLYEGARPAGERLPILTNLPPR